MTAQEWYDGPYTVVDGIDNLASKPRPALGDIIAHRSGAVVLRCPKCHAMQFTRAEIYNSKEHPTLDRPIHCGSGHCKKCGIWFTIKNGTSCQVDPPEKKTRKISDKLAKAGVHAPPKLNIKKQPQDS